MKPPAHAEGLDLHGPNSVLVTPEAWVEGVMRVFLCEQLKELGGWLRDLLCCAPPYKRRLTDVQ
jgi:hypothetical protein